MIGGSMADYRETIIFRADEMTLRALDMLAERTNQSKSHIIRTLIIMAAEQLRKQDEQEAAEKENE
jgi:predicted transcriptional regulator